MWNTTDKILLITVVIMVIGASIFFTWMYLIAQHNDYCNNWAKSLQNKINSLEANPLSSMFTANSLQDDSNNYQQQCVYNH